MHYVTATLGIVLAVFALMHIGLGRELWWAGVFGICAFLALITLKRNMSLLLVRSLAVLSSIAMFWCLAGFFRLAPSLHPEWYERAAAVHAIGLLFAGFAMIAVLSEYSCRMKSGRCPHSQWFKLKGTRLFRSPLSRFSRQNAPQPYHPLK